MSQSRSFRAVTFLSWVKLRFVRPVEVCASDWRVERVEEIEDRAVRSEWAESPSFWNELRGSTVAMSCSVCSTSPARTP
jgi:hypothetical protein